MHTPFSPLRSLRLFVLAGSTLAVTILATASDRLVPDDYASIREAIKASVTGEDRVIVTDGGSHAESLVIDKSVELISDPPGARIAEGEAGSGVVLRAGATSVTIQGFEITGWPKHGVLVAPGGEAGVSLALRGTRIAENGTNGLFLQSGKDHLIQITNGSELRSNGLNGIEATCPARIQLIDSEIVDNDYCGINVHPPERGGMIGGGLAHVAMERTTISGHKESGLVVTGDFDCKIAAADVVIENNRSAGLFLNVDATRGATLVMNDSTVNGHGGPGICSANSAQFTLTGCEISGNGHQGVVISPEGRWAQTFGTEARVAMTDCSVTSNTAGGILLADTMRCSLEMTDSRASWNGSSGLLLVRRDAGALSPDRRTTVTLRNCSFESNKSDGATILGGWEYRVAITDSRFESNALCGLSLAPSAEWRSEFHATGSVLSENGVQGIALLGSGSVEFTGCAVDGNGANGFAFCPPPQESALSPTRISLTDCSFSGQPGGVCLTGAGDADVTIGDSVLRDNFNAIVVAPEDSHGIRLRMTDTTIEANRDQGIIVSASAVLVSAQKQASLPDAIRDSERWTLLSGPCSAVVENCSIGQARPLVTSPPAPLILAAPEELPERLFPPDALRPLAWENLEPSRRKSIPPPGSMAFADLESGSGNADPGFALMEAGNLFRAVERATEESVGDSALAYMAANPMSPIACRLFQNLADDWSLFDSPDGISALATIVRDSPDSALADAICTEIAMAWAHVPNRGESLDCFVTSCSLPPDSLAGILLAACGETRQKGAFSEDWESGQVDTDRWDTRQDGETVVAVEDISGDGSDHALVMWAGPLAQAWISGVKSTARFVPGSGLRVEALLWGDPSRSNGTYTYPQGAGWSFGLYRDADVRTPFYTEHAAVLDDWYVPMHGNKAFRFSQSPLKSVFDPSRLDMPEGGKPPPTLSEEFTEAVIQATDKASAVRVAITLEESGARFEWRANTAGGEWRKEEADIGLPPQVPQAVSLGFAPCNASVYIDDITVSGEMIRRSEPGFLGRFAEAYALAGERYPEARRMAQGEFSHRALRSEGMAPSGIPLYLHRCAVLSRCLDLALAWRSLGDEETGFRYLELARRIRLGFRPLSPDAFPLPTELRARFDVVLTHFAIPPWITAQVLVDTVEVPGQPEAVNAGRADALRKIMTLSSTLDSLPEIHSVPDPDAMHSRVVERLLDDLCLLLRHGENPLFFETNASFLASEVFPHFPLHQRPGILDKLAARAAEEESHAGRAVATYHGFMAEQYRTLGNASREAAHLNALADANADDDTTVAALERLTALHEEHWQLPLQAIETQREILSRFPGSDRANQARLKIAKILYGEKQFAESAYELTVLLQAMPEDADDSPVRSMLGLTYMGRGDYDEARNEFAAVINTDEGPYREKCLYLMGYSFICEQQYQEAVRPFNDLLYLYPSGSYADKAKDFLQKLEPGEE